MMRQTRASDLKSAFILLKCDKKTNHDDCRQIRDALLEKYPNVRRAYTTNTKIRGEQWCVAATALVNAAKQKEFEKRLWKLETKSKHPIGISNVRLVVDQQ